MQKMQGKSRFFQIFESLDLWPVEIGEKAFEQSKFGKT